MAWILQKGFPFCPNRPCSLEKGKVLFLHYLTYTFPFQRIYNPLAPSMGICNPRNM